MPSQEFEEATSRQDSNGTYSTDATQRASYPDGPRQRLRRERGPGEDLFLSLALNESDFSGNKRQSMPAKPNLRQPATERPRSSGSIVGSSHHESFPVLDSFRQPLSRRDSPLFPRRSNGATLEPSRGSTPTPSQYATPNPRYRSGHDHRSPEQLRFTRGRPASNTFSEAMSQQHLHRLGGYDSSKEARTTYEQDTVMHSPNTPGGPKRSDPETESAGSVTAPSTVWDELDDLKSRIRNLEITGKTPSTSAAAIANHSGDRPRTATTAPTTVSSSPQHVRKNSVAPSEVTVGGLPATNVHPLLHNALAKAKPLLNPALYRALEATAADALALAAMTGSSGPQGTAYSAASVVTGINVSDRQIRRKADSMCRNMTDLCIALCEGKSDLASPGFRPSPATTFRFQGNTPPSQYTRRGSVEPNDRILRASPGRSFSRLETRRSSLLGLGLNNNNNNASSPRETSEQYPQSQEQSPSQSHVDYAARHNRPGTSLLRTRYTEEQPEEPPLRAPSRAMTEIGQIRQRRSENATGLQPRSPGYRETLAARRTTLGIPEEIVVDEQLESPPGSTYQVGSLGYLERHRPSPSETGILEPNKRRRRIMSLEQYSPSSRLGSEPMRTTSLSRRRNGGQAGTYAQ